MTSTTAHVTRRGTTIEAPDDLPLLRIVREFAAPPPAVFRAHTDPALLVRWLGPADLVMEVDVWDCRNGGEYRYLHRGSGEEHAFRGCFHEVRRDRRIVQTFTYEPFPDTVALETLTLDEVGPGRTLLTVVSVAGSFEARDAMVSSGMEGGIRESHTSLDDVLAGGAGRTSTTAAR